MCEGVTVIVKYFTAEESTECVLEDRLMSQKMKRKMLMSA